MQKPRKDAIIGVSPAKEGFRTKLNRIDVPKLDELIGKAKGNIYLVTDDGNRMNLKSKLCRLYGIHQLLEGARNSKVRAELDVENSDDELMFVDYMMRK